MTRDDLEVMLETLARQAWDGEVKHQDISSWSKNFCGEVLPTEEERMHSLLGLTRFVYFGRRMVREMLRAIYHDQFKVPLVQRVRRNLRGTRDAALIDATYQKELAATRFFGIGNPSESGTHLLYYFRQVNELNRSLFCDLDGAFSPKILRNDKEIAIGYEQRDPAVSRFVFFDDLVGSGDQAVLYLCRKLADIRSLNPNIDIRMLCLFATKEGLDKLNSPAMFNGKAASLFELDEAYRAFSVDSRYFHGSPDWFSKDKLKEISTHYGEKLWPSCANGYKDGQLLLGFSYNTPDNTLPIFWKRASSWMPVFERFHKVY